MCESCSPGRPGISRRRFGLVTAAGAAGLVSLATRPDAASARVSTRSAVSRPEILARETWAQGRDPKGELPAEDPKFLLVHHTAEPGNDYATEDVPVLLQGIFDYHTGSAKGWPDVAYNFFIDHDGRIWEGRQGSLAGPVRGSATGGNQGWSQLCCFLGNFETELPSQAAQRSMVTLLAWLGDRYGIDTSPGATVEVESLGSNRWPAGTMITTSTIAGHRDMSMTTCPGDSAYAWVTGALPASVSAVRLAQGPPTPSTSSAPGTTASPTTSPGPPAPEPADGTATTDDTPDSATTTSSGQLANGNGNGNENTDGGSGAGMPGSTKVALTTGAVLAAGAGAIGLLRAMRHRDDVRHAGSHWVLEAYSTPEPADDSGAKGSSSPGRSSSSEHREDLPHIGSDGALAWVIHGGWPPETVESAVTDLASVAESSGLRSTGAELVRRLGPSPDGEATVMLFMERTGDPDSVFQVLGVGRGQISVRSATGSDLLSCPLEAEPAAGSSFLVRLGGGAAEVTVEHRSTGASS